LPLALSISFRTFRFLGFFQRARGEIAQFGCLELDMAKRSRCPLKSSAFGRSRGCYAAAAWSVSVALDAQRVGVSTA
jgi:hypothetical protein